MPQQVFVYHSIPGRVRLGFAPVPAALSDHIAQIAAVPGVISVRPYDKGLVIRYDEDLPLQELLDRLAVTAPRLAELGSLRVQDMAPPGRPLATAPDPDRTVEKIISFFSWQNAATSQVTQRRADLRVLVPGTLMGYGLLKLVLDPKAGTPHWMNLLWFGFNTFVSLNQRIIRDTPSQEAS